MNSAPLICTSIGWMMMSLSEKLYHLRGFLLLLCNNFSLIFIRTKIITDDNIIRKAFYESFLHCASAVSLQNKYGVDI